MQSVHLWNAGNVTAEFPALPARLSSTDVANNDRGTQTLRPIQCHTSSFFYHKHCQGFTPSPAKYTLVIAENDTFVAFNSYFSNYLTFRDSFEKHFFWKWSVLKSLGLCKPVPEWVILSVVAFYTADSQVSRKNRLWVFWIKNRTEKKNRQRHCRSKDWGQKLKRLQKKPCM